MNKIVRKEIDNFTIGDDDDPNNPEEEIEETKFYTADSYDDNLNLIGYNSEFKDTKTGKIIGIVDFYGNEQETRIRYCPHCQSFELKHMLGPMLIKHGQKRPEDHENWLSCYHCGNTYPRFEPMAHGKLVLPTEQHVEENPHEAKNSVVIGFNRGRSRKKKQQYHPDPDINREMKNHGSDNVRIIEDSMGI